MMLGHSGRERGQRERLVEEVEWVRDFFVTDGRQRIPLRDVLIALAQRPNLDFNQDGSAVFGALSYATLGSVSGLRPGVGSAPALWPASDLTGSL